MAARTAAHLVARNAAAGFLGRFATLAVGLVMAPYLLSSLGVEAFGIWALVTIVTGSLGLMDLSIRVPLVKYLAEDDPEARSAIASTAFAVSCAVSVVAVVVFAVLRQPLLAWLSVPEALASDALGVFTIGVASLFVGVVLSVFPAICDARQRMEVTNGLGVAALLVGAVLTVTFVERGGGVRGVAWAQFAAVSLFHATAVVAARRCAPEVSLDWRAVSSAWARRLLSFGGTVHLGRACGVVSRELDKVLLARWGGLPLTAAYELGVKLVSAGFTLVWFLSTALLPAASGLASAGRRDDLAVLHATSFRYLCLFSFPLFAFVALMAPSLVEVWAGQPVPFAATTATCLALGYLAAALTSGMTHIAQGAGRPGLQLEQSVLQLATNLVASIVLYRWLGPIGAPMGTSVALVLGAAWMMLRLHRALEMSGARLVRTSVLAPLLCTLGASLAGAAASGTPTDASGRGLLLHVTWTGVVFVVTFAFLSGASGAVGLAELQRLGRLVITPARITPEPGN